MAEDALSAWLLQHKVPEEDVPTVVSVLRAERVKSLVQLTDTVSVPELRDILISVIKERVESRITAKRVEMAFAALMVPSTAPLTSESYDLVEITESLHGPVPLPLAAPEDVGLSTQRLRALSAWSDGWVESGKIPGMLTCIVRRGKLVYLHTSGKADVEADRPMAPNTIVRLYSLSKPLVSVCAMCLYERGLFQLDEPISHHLPSFANPTVMLPSGEAVPAKREITFADLLTHTAGLTYGDGDGPVDAAYKAAGCGWDAPYAALNSSRYTEPLHRAVSRGTVLLEPVRYGR